MYNIWYKLKISVPIVEKGCDNIIRIINDKIVLNNVFII